MKNDEKISISLCLSDIPKTRIKKASNGKLYTNISVVSRKEVDEYGHDLNVISDPTKEEWDAQKQSGEKSKTTYCGNAKTFVFKDVATAANVEQMPAVPENFDIERDL